MRVVLWRRAAVVLALVLGLGAAAPAAEASTTPTTDHTVHTVTAAEDWWW